MVQPLVDSSQGLEHAFRQVRKMTSAVGFPTLRLVRVRVGGIALNVLQPGDVVEMENFILDF